MPENDLALSPPGPRGAPAVVCFVRPRLIRSEFSVCLSGRGARRDGARGAERRRAAHPLHPAVQRARAAPRRGLEQRQPRAAGSDAGAAAAAEG
eukprot:scaffold12477_cov51-Phaeocystis_antarctica.AAC.3